MKKLMVGCLAAMLTIVHAESVVTAEALLHHNYVLVAIDGDDYPLALNAMSPNIEFGENLYVSGAMCNNFFGKGQLKDGVLIVEPLGMARKFCEDDVLNRLDHLIGQLLETGATVTLKNNGQDLVLSDEKTTLEFKLKDYVI